MVGVLPTIIRSWYNKFRRRGRHSHGGDHPPLRASLAENRYSEERPAKHAHGHEKRKAGLAHGLVHWVFDREALCGQRGLVGAVISAAGEHQELTQEELGLRVHRELQQQISNLPDPLWTRVIAEKRATFACTPGVRRPPQVTPLKNFYLAGDYTASDYPATIESAVRSGIACARHILQRG